MLDNLLIQRFIHVHTLASHSKIVLHVLGLHSLHFSHMVLHFSLCAKNLVSDDFLLSILLEMFSELLVDFHCF